MLYVYNIMITSSSIRARPGVPEPVKESPSLNLPRSSRPPHLLHHPPTLTDNKPYVILIPLTLGFFSSRRRRRRHRRDLTSPAVFPSPAIAEAPGLGGWAGGDSLGPTARGTQNTSEGTMDSTASGSIIHFFWANHFLLFSGRS